MKKLLAILLIITMVLPLCVFTNAAETQVEIKPYVITNTEDLGTNYDNFYGKVLFWTKTGDESYVSETGMRVSAMNGVGGANPKEVAENLKPVFDEFPEGTRYIRMMSLRAAMITLLEDHIYMEKGVKVMKEWFDEFITHYYSIGGKLDGVVTDVEYFDAFSYDITKIALSDPYIFQKIESNPLYETKIRPKLVERGFKFWPNVTDETPELYAVSENSGSAYSQSRAIWNVVIRNHYNQYVDDAFKDSLLKYYPEAILTDYQARTTYSWHKTMGQTGGPTTGGNYYTAGNVNYINCYAYTPGPAFFQKDGQKLYQNIPSYNGTVWEDTPYNMVLWETITAKNYYESAPDNKLTVTITFYNYSSRETSYCNSPYYAEHVYHMGLLDPQPFESYCIGSEIEARGSDIDYSIKIISELLDELTRVAGAADRKPIIVPYTWNDRCILSGIYAGGKNIWRITPDMSKGMTKEQFKVSGTKDPTFYIDGQTVTFPGGKIIEDATITEVGTCGYWVETAQDVMPVVTYPTNRYQEYPALIETYETYDAGKNFDASIANPSGCWEVKKDKTSSAVVVDNGGNKVLALSGTYALKVKGVLKNITAGDTYAENQAWEVEATIPANMGADAEVVLLDIYNHKANAIVGGFRIAGGKLYYDNAGTYVEMAGVDMSAGGKYRFLRSVDFNNPEAFTSDYFVYDASGNLVAEAKNVAMPKIDLPVEKIGFSVTNITGDAVLMDNLKLYADGVATDFELYDAYTGMEVATEDLDKVRDKDTAYRLSWMNATAYEKVYSVVAAYYNGDTLVEEKVLKQITMIPGTDGVATGIVNLEAGKSVRIYLRNDSQPEPDGTTPVTPGADNATQGAKKSNETLMLIITIVGVVAFLGLVVFAVLVVLKKPAAKEEKQAETQETEKTEE